MNEINLNDLEILVGFCKSEYPESVMILYQEIDKLCEKILVSLKEIAISENSLYSLKQKTDMAEYSKIVSYKESLIKHKDSLLEFLEFIKPESYTVLEAEGDEETEDIVAEKLKIDYSDDKFNEDKSIAHHLYDDFQNTLPCGFEIEGNYFSVYQWKDMLIKTCEYLNTQYREIFLSFANDDTIQGRSRRNFAQSQTDITKKPCLIPNTGVYIETNHSANCIRNLIIKMLDKCGIPKKCFKIFLNKNYKSIHIKDEVLERSSSEETDVLKIGETVRNLFKEIFERGVSDEEIQNFLDKEWSHATFDIGLALLRKIDKNIPIREQSKDYSGRSRYWQEEIIINGGSYILCSQWFKDKADVYLRKIETWQKSRVSPTMETERSQDAIKSTEKTTDSTFNYIRIGKQQNSFSLPCDLVSDIFTFMLDNKNDDNYFTTSSAAEAFEGELKQYYKEPLYAIGKLIDFLMDVKVVRLYKNNKKKNYEIIDEQRLSKLIHFPNIIETGNWNVDIPTQKQKVKIYIIGKNSKNRCPICGEKYLHHNVEYSVYDFNRQVSGTKKLQTKVCNKCKKHFITQDTYKTNYRNLSDAMQNGELEFEAIK